MSKISIIIPVYWNSDTLMILYQDMRDKLLNKLDNYEIVFVDDGSGDNSWEIINKIHNMDSNVCCVKLSRNFGEHAAILAGLSVCTGDCAVTKQADLQENSELILDMYKSWKHGNKVVLALRKSRDENPLKVFFANMYYSVVRCTVTKRMPKGGCDCFLIDRQVIDVLEKSKEQNSSLMLQVLWSGFQTGYVYFNRTKSKSKKSYWTLAKKIKLIMDSVIPFSRFPIRTISTVGVFFIALSVVVLIGLIVRHFTYNLTIPSGSLLSFVILLCTGFVMISIGILGEYLWRVLDASKPRPPYIIDSISKSKQDYQNNDLNN